MSFVLYRVVSSIENTWLLIHIRITKV